MLDFSSLSKATASLKESIDVVVDYEKNNSGCETPIYRTMRAGVIQNFEFCYELSWKAMRVWLAENVSRDLVDGITRKELFRLAAKYQLIGEPTAWFQFHQMRNQTSHTYDEMTAQTVFKYAEPLLEKSVSLLACLNDKND